MTLFATLSRAQMDRVSVRRRRADSSLEESMQLFATWTAEEEQPGQEAAPVPEPETPRPTAAAHSAKSDEQLAVAPAATAARHANSCPDLLVRSLKALLLQLAAPKPTETLQNNGLALPAQVPKWMLAAREMDPPNSLVTTVSLPSNWDAAPLTARLSSSSIFNIFTDPVPASDKSSIFNLFSDPVAPSPVPSLFAINPAGVTSGASTVSVPTSFWDTPSAVSVGGAGASAVSIPSGFFGVRPATSRSSSIAVEMSDDTSSASSLFADPREAPSSTYSLFLDPRSAAASATSAASGLCADCLLARALNTIWNGNPAQDETAAAAETCDCKRPATEKESATSHHNSSTSNDSLLAGALHRLWNGIPAPEDVTTPRTPSDASTCDCEDGALNEDDTFSGCSCDGCVSGEEEEEGTKTCLSFVPPSTVCSCIECGNIWRAALQTSVAAMEAVAVPSNASMVAEDPWHFAPDCPDCQTDVTDDADEVVVEEAVEAAVEADDVTSSCSLSTAILEYEPCGGLKSCLECKIVMCQDTAADWEEYYAQCRAAEAEAEAAAAVDKDAVSSASSGYETDVDSVEEPEGAVVLRQMTSTTSATTQSEAECKAEAARMIAEIDDMLAKVTDIRKKLMEML